MSRRKLIEIEILFLSDYDSKRQTNRDKSCGRWYQCWSSCQEEVRVLPPPCDAILTEIIVQGFNPFLVLKSETSWVTGCWPKLQLIALHMIIIHEWAWENFKSLVRSCFCHHFTCWKNIFWHLSCSNEVCFHHPKSFNYRCVVSVVSDTVTTTFSVFLISQTASWPSLYSI